MSEHEPTTEPTDFVFCYKLTVRATQGESEEECERWLANRLAELGLEDFEEISPPADDAAHYEEEINHDYPPGRNL